MTDCIETITLSGVLSKSTQKYPILSNWNLANGSSPSNDWSTMAPLFTSREFWHMRKEDGLSVYYSCTGSDRQGNSRSGKNLLFSGSPDLCPALCPSLLFPVSHSACMYTYTCTCIDMQPYFPVDMQRVGRLWHSAKHVHMRVAAFIREPWKICGTSAKMNEYGFRDAPCKKSWNLCVYMLGTDLKPAARFKAVQTYLQPSGRFRSRPDGLRAVQTASKLSVRTNVVTKPSSKRAAKPSCP